VEGHMRVLQDQLEVVVHRMNKVGADATGTL
jgi:hypothetical protein